MSESEAEVENQDGETSIEVESLDLYSSAGPGRLAPAVSRHPPERNTEVHTGFRSVSLDSLQVS